MKTMYVAIWTTDDWPKQTNKTIIGILIYVCTITILSDDGVQAELISLEIQQ